MGYYRPKYNQVYKETLTRTFQKSSVGKTYFDHMIDKMRKIEEDRYPEEGLASCSKALAHHKSFESSNSSEIKHPGKKAGSPLDASQRSSPRAKAAAEEASSQRHASDCGEVECRCRAKERRFLLGKRARGLRINLEKNYSFDFRKMQKPTGLFDPPCISTATASIDYNPVVPLLHPVRNVRIAPIPKCSPLTASFMTDPSAHYPTGYINSFYNDDLDKSIQYIESHVFSKAKTKHLNYPHHYSLIPSEKAPRKLPDPRFKLEPPQWKESLEDIYRENLKLIA